MNTVFVEVRDGVVARVYATDPRAVDVVVDDPTLRGECPEVMSRNWYEATQMNHALVEPAGGKHFRWLGSM